MLSRSMASTSILPDTEEIDDSGPDIPPLLLAAEESGRLFTDMKEEALVDAIRRLVDSIYIDDRKAAGRLAETFSGIARKEPIELAPGILLLHTHAEGITLPTVAIGARPGGWNLMALPAPVRITVILVSPVVSGPEVHLEALTQLALAFRSMGLAERLLQG